MVEPVSAGAASAAFRLGAGAEEVPFVGGAGFGILQKKEMDGWSAGGPAAGGVAVFPDGSSAFSVLAAGRLLGRGPSLA